MKNKEKNQRFFCPSFFPKTRKGQVWGLDLFIAVVIFLAGIMILYLYSINYLSQSDGGLENLFYEGNLASELILSENDFGILTDSRVNQSKLNEFALNYDTRKKDIGVLHNFYFKMEGLEVSGNSTSYVGKMNTLAIENVIQITRIAIYKNTPTKFQLYVWS